ncbi:MAG: hypothetical protein LQ339_008433 [Xanthoria mediterranea]|nr:MAG: hypothetical protein LQ339_008433 [Xanthoria mediterranea]
MVDELSSSESDTMAAKGTTSESSDTVAAKGTTPKSSDTMTTKGTTSESSNTVAAKGRTSGSFSSVTAGAVKGTTSTSSNSMPGKLSKSPVGGQISESSDTMAAKAITSESFGSMTANASSTLFDNQPGSSSFDSTWSFDKPPTWSFNGLAGNVSTTPFSSPSGSSSGVTAAVSNTPFNQRPAMSSGNMASTIISNALFGRSFGSDTSGFQSMSASKSGLPATATDTPTDTPTPNGFAAPSGMHPFGMPKDANVADTVTMPKDADAADTIAMPKDAADTIKELRMTVASLQAVVVVEQRAVVAIKAEKQKVEEENVRLKSADTAKALEINQMRGQVNELENLKIRLRRHAKRRGITVNELTGISNLES